MSATPKVDAFEAAQSKGQDYQDLERDYIALLALARELERNPRVIGMDVSAAGLTIGPMIKIAAPDGSYIYGAANPTDWFDANGDQKRALYKTPKRTAYIERDSIGQLVTVRIEES